MEENISVCKMMKMKFTSDGHPGLGALDILFQNK
jgi:hypothetical protein